MRLYKQISLWLACALLAYTASGQAPQPRQPSPELTKLDYFAGTWKAAGELKAGPMGPGGSITGTDRWEWQKGNFFLIGHTDYQGPMGSGTELSIMGFDPKEKVYTYQSFSSDGEHEMANGTLDGDTWTWTSSDPNSPFKWRYLEKIVSKTSFTSKFEVSQDGTNWMTVMESKATKQ